MCYLIQLTRQIGFRPGTKLLFTTEGSFGCPARGGEQMVCSIDWVPNHGVRGLRGELKAATFELFSTTKP